MGEKAEGQMPGRIDWKRRIAMGVAALVVGSAATAQPAAVPKVTGNSAPNALARMR